MTYKSSKSCQSKNERHKLRGLTNVFLPISWENYRRGPGKGVRKRTGTKGGRGMANDTDTWLMRAVSESEVEQFHRESITDATSQARRAGTQVGVTGKQMSHRNR